MSTHRMWKTWMGVIFLLAIMCLVMQPVFAAEKSKNKEKEKIAANVETPTQSHQEKVLTILANTSGPPITPGPGGPGWYVKQHGANKGWVKYFKHGHPENGSEWKWQNGQSGPGPYGK